MNQPSTKPNSTSHPNPSPNSNARAPPALAAPAAECGNCGSQKRWVLHHVRIRGIHRRLCTSCVLRLHPSSFCPSCFQCYDTTNTPVSSKRLTCAKCSSFTHSHCASPPPPSSSSSSTTTNTTPSSSTFFCPPCATPNFTFFDLDSDPNKAIDKRLALVLLCASKIASTSMAKAVIVARAEAERRVREAALARKRAREALDHLALLVHSRGDKVVRKDVAEVSAEVSGSANLVQTHKEKEKNPPLVPNSQGKEMFNGFNSPRQNPAMKPSGSPPNKKSNNGEQEHGGANQSNGNVNKEKSGGLVNRESMELEQKNHGRGENVPAAK